MNSIAVRVVFLMLGALCAAAAGAQAFPSKPIRIIVPYGPGGTTDAVARAVLALINESTGQPVIIEHRPGAGTVVGMRACAKATPDGHTVCITVPDSLSYNPHLFTDVQYDPENDFTPITNLAFTSNLLVASARAPFNTFKEMIAHAKAKPGSLNWGTWGAATLPDIYLRWVRHRAGVDIAAVPYKGLAPVVAAMYSGEVDVTYIGFGTALPQIKAGKLKPIVTVGNRRSVHMPELPTLAEEGGDPDLTSYFGVFGPSRLPPAVLERLNREFATAIRSPRLQEFRRSYTLEAVGNSATEFAQFVRADRANAGRLFKSIGIRPTNVPF
ncbi:MAG: tripartite tricarboxylate transporter substrate binding protein [Burkholderiales bacterium]|nr:tripartite tricarboxylate transporter substrate binding protein [Burkholderiales bacterium]